MIKKILPFLLTLLAIYFLSTVPVLFSKAASLVTFNESERMLCAHSECLDNICVIVDGIGPDQCLSDSDCEGAIQPPTVSEPPLTVEPGLTLPPVSSPGPMPIIPPIPSPWPLITTIGGGGGGVDLTAPTTEPRVNLTGWTDPDPDNPNYSSTPTLPGGGEIDPEGIIEDGDTTIILPGAGENLVLPFIPQGLSRLIQPFVSHAMAETILPIEIPLPGNGYDFSYGYTYAPYTQCQGNQCILIPEACGIDECASDEDCGIQKHRMCDNFRCLEVLGEGPDTCDLDNDCGVSFSCDSEFGMCYQDSSGLYTDVEACFNNCFVTQPPVDDDLGDDGSEDDGLGDDLGDDDSGDDTIPPIVSGICTINDFSFNGQDNTIRNPLINISGVPTKLIFQTNSDTDCERCELSCVPDNCGLNSELQGNVDKPFNKEYAFRFPRVSSPVNYTYKIECWGTSGNYVAKDINIKIFPMFNWREINPGSF
ncbi:MAG: hypothetical protein KBI15_00250 [Candidatus Pacebacteria bacterium]|nr:hypothetical protein [Candidatus Paceibacterota bacterium]